MFYHINRYICFGKFNCKYTYQENLMKDKTNELHKLSLIIFEFKKKI